MGVIERIRKFFSKIMRESSETKRPLSEMEWNRKHRTSLKRVRENLTELVFQRKKMELQIQKLTEEDRVVNQDLEQAALQDKDDVANYLMNRQDEIQKERTLLTEHLRKVLLEIKRTKSVESQLVEQLEKAKLQFAILKSRRDSVAMRKQLESRLSSVSTGTLMEGSAVTEVEEEIMRMESALETLDTHESQISKDVETLRSQRLRVQTSSRLLELKKRLRSRQLPAGRSVSGAMFREESAVVQHS